MQSQGNRIVKEEPNEDAQTVESASGCGGACSGDTCRDTASAGSGSHFGDGSVSSGWGPCNFSLRASDTSHNSTAQATAPLMEWHEMQQEKKRRMMEVPKLVEVKSEVSDTDAAMGFDMGR